MEHKGNELWHLQKAFNYYETPFNMILAFAAHLCRVFDSESGDVAWLWKVCGRLCRSTSQIQEASVEGWGVGLSGDRGDRAEGGWVKVDSSDYDSKLICCQWRSQCKYVTRKLGLLLGLSLIWTWNDTVLCTYLFWEENKVMTTQCWETYSKLRFFFWVGGR